MNKANEPLTVHPATEAYRLMTEDELAALAADIADNGQHDPIILGRVAGSKEQHQIVDGRNRAKACGIGKVMPKFEVREFESDEAIRAFVKSRSERRDISKGQRAMGVALLFPDPDKGGRGKKKVPETGGFSRQRLGDARTVLAYSRDLALAVRDGTESLDAALATVTAERQKLDTEMKRRAYVAEHGTPELIAAVDRGEVPVSEAVAFARSYKPSQQDARIMRGASVADAVTTANAAKTTKPAGPVVAQEEPGLFVGDALREQDRAVLTTVTLREEWREPLAGAEKALGVPIAEFVDFMLRLGVNAFNRKFQTGLTNQIEMWLVDMHTKYPDTFNVGSWEGSCGHLSIDNLRAKHVENLDRPARKPEAAA